MAGLPQLWGKLCEMDGVRILINLEGPLGPSEFNNKEKHFGHISVTMQESLQDLKDTWNDFLKH